MFLATGPNQPSVSRILSKEMKIKHGIQMDYASYSSPSEESQIEEEDSQENNYTLNNQNRSIIGHVKLAKMKRFSKIKKLFTQRDGSNSDQQSKRQDKHGLSSHQNGYKSDRGEDRMGNQHFDPVKVFQISI